MNEKYEAKTLLFKDLGKISKPPFQRGFKWSLKKQAELITSVRDGLPFGTFLLEEKKGKYSILDGQQRYTTLLNYKNDMTPFISSKDINVDKLINSLKDISSTKNEIKKNEEKIEKINYKNIFKTNKGKIKETTQAISDKLCELLDIKLTSSIIHSIEEKIESWVNEILNPLDVDNIKIPVIVLTDEIDDKAEVFVKLNQGGIKLTKYELLAASWSDENSKLCCDDNEILNHIIDRYKNVTNKEIEFDSFDEDEIKRTDNGYKNINAYEYLFGLSKVIDEKIAEIIGKRKTEETAFGFIIVSEIFDIPSKDLQGLDKKLVKFKELTDLKNKIVESVDAIYKKLKKEFEVPNGRVYLDHTENQISSLIVAYFKTKYNIENGEIKNKNSKQDKRNLENIIDYLPQHYIYDNLTDYWVGTGDKKMHDLVKDASLKDCKYYQSVNKNDIEMQISKWFDSKNIDDSKSVKSDTKMILSYLLNKTAKELKVDEGVKWEWEHIGIKSKLIENHLLAGISSPSNITLIPKIDNNEKQKLTYYEYNRAKGKKSLFKLDDKDLISLLYPTHDDIKWVEGSKTISKEEFFDFKEHRTAALKNILLNELFNKNI